MGTTVTSNLGLIKPDTNESIKANMPTFAGWAAQNTINMDKIDALFRASVASYTPTWGGSITPPTLGAGGFTDAKYIRIHPRMVAVFFRLYFGGVGAALGSGSYTISLPVAIDPVFLQASAIFSASVPMGKMIFQDNNAVASSSVFSLNYSVAFNAMIAYVTTVGAACGTWGPTIPVTLGQQDRFTGYFVYPTAVP